MFDLVEKGYLAKGLIACVTLVLKHVDDMSLLWNGCRTGGWRRHPTFRELTLLHHPEICQRACYSKHLHVVVAPRYPLSQSCQHYHSMDQYSRSSGRSTYVDTKLTLNKYRIDDR